MTLVEMIVVLAIIGVAAAAVTLSFRPGQDAARIEANRFADQLQLAADEALIAGAPVAVDMTPNGYRFAAAPGHTFDDEPDAHELPAGVRLWAPVARLSVDPDGARPPVVMTLRDRAHVWSVTFDGLTASVAAAPDAA